MVRAVSRKLAAILVLAVTVGIAAQAGVLVINNLTGNVTWIKAPLVFEAGTNAGAGTGINGTAINVDITNDGATATVSFYVPNGTVFVIDALRITNQGNTTLYFNFTTVEAPAAGEFKNISIIVYDPGTKQVQGAYQVLNTTTVTQAGVSYFQIPANSTYILILKFVNGTAWVKNTTATFTVHLRYSTNATELAYTQLG